MSCLFFDYISYGVGVTDGVREGVGDVAGFWVAVAGFGVGEDAPPFGVRVGVGVIVGGTRVLSRDSASARISGVITSSSSLSKSCQDLMASRMSLRCS